MVARQYLAPFFWCVLFFCSLLGVVVFRHANAAAATAEDAWGESDSLPAVALEPITDQEAKIVVSPAGVVHAVHPKTRQVIWKYESGSEMGCKLKALTSHLNSDVDEESDDQTVYSGPDGKLYVVEGTEVGSTTVNLKDLLANTPRHTEDGAVVLSTTTSTGFLLNKETGALIRKFQMTGSMLEKAASVASGKAETEDAERLLNSDTEKDVPTVLCLRTDYSVVVQEVKTGAVRWNISLADIKTLSLVEPSGQTPMLGPSKFKPTKATVSPSLGSVPAYNPAPIGLFTPKGEYISDLLPASSSALAEPGRKWNPRSDPVIHFGKPKPVRVNGNGLIPMLAGVTQDSYTQGRLPGPSLDNSSADRFNFREGYELTWGTFGALVLLVTGIASSVWYLYSRFVSGRREKVDKPKKVGHSKGRKRGKKSSAVASSTSNRGSEDDGNEAYYSPLDGLESLGSRGIATNQGYGEGIQVGRLFVSKVVIGSGSNGTSVFEGYLDGRHVAVKRLLANHYDKAVKEIQFLITSDEHPNVVRYFAMEVTSDFVYVALERCAGSLYDLVVSESEKCSSKGAHKEDGSRSFLKMPEGKDVKLWNDGRCTPQLIGLMRDIVAGLAHLHAVGIVHRDLKPHNVLVSNVRKLQAKLADMGLSKHLAIDVSSYQDTGKGGSGSRGWQAPEQLKEGRQTRAVDVFSLGCLLFFCITQGQHPYGEHFLRDANIAKGTPDFFAIEDMPEALHLIAALLAHEPSKRPAAKDVLAHPFFWSEDDRLQFLLKASDRVEHEDRVADSAVLSAIEAIGDDVFGISWESKLDAKLLDDGRRYRKYNFNSVRDLLRIIRNKSHHFRELPLEMQESLGSPEGFETYFTSKFPRLLMEVYKVMQEHCKDELTFKRFFEANHAV